MRGLIEKDLRLTLMRKETLSLFMAMALIMGISVDGSFVIVYFVMLATITSVGTLSYDEFDNGFSFLMTLPFERKTYVKEKYVFSLITAAAAWVLGVAIYGIAGVVKNTGGNLASELPMLITVIPAMFISVSVMIPIQLKFGSEKSKIVLFIIFGAFALLVLYFSGSVTDDAENAFTGIVNVLESFPPYGITLAVTIISAVAALVSYRFSARIMENREF